jgi:hypothetical protein
VEINTPNNVITSSPRGKVISFTSSGEPLSYHYDEYWDFIGMESVAIGKNTKVNFSSTNPKYIRTIQDTLYDLYNFDKQINLQPPSSRKLESWRKGLQLIAEILESNNWGRLNDDRVYRSFKRKLKSLNLGIQTIKTEIITTLNRLHSSEVINRSINGLELVALAKTNRSVQAIAIPINMYQRLLTNCIEVIELYHPFRNEIARVMHEAYEIERRFNNDEDVLNGMKRKGIKGGERVLSKTRKDKLRRSLTASKLLIKHNIPDFDIAFNGVQLGKLQTACVMVVLAFSGARIGEAQSFNNESYTIESTDDNKKIMTLQGETTKGNDGIPKHVTWQSHIIAKDALELAQCISEPLRIQYKKKIQSKLETGEYSEDRYKQAIKEVNSAFIPCSPSVQKVTYITMGVHAKINKLMKSMDIRATTEDIDEFNLLNPTREGKLILGGHLPKLTPHDFRRSFAVFFKRYGFGAASGIKFQYKHKNINMSEYYANNADLMRMNDILMDTELLKLMQEEGIRLGVDVYDDIYNKSEHLSGVEGERISVDKFERIKSGHHIYMDRSEIERLIKHGDISVVQLPNGGYCTNSSCERLCGMGLFVTDNYKCPHTVHTDKTAKKMSKQRQRIINQFREFNTGDRLRNSILVGLKKK